jgi:hypothetical protein
MTLLGAKEERLDDMDVVGAGVGERKNMSDVTLALRLFGAQVKVLEKRPNTY